MLQTERLLALCNMDGPSCQVKLSPLLLKRLNNKSRDLSISFGEQTTHLLLHSIPATMNSPQFIFQYIKQKVHLAQSYYYATETDSAGSDTRTC